MGNTSTKERSESPTNGQSSGSSLRRHDRHNGEGSSHLSRLAMLSGEGYSSRSRSRSNLEHTLFGLGSGSREQRERDREAEKEARELRRAEREKERLKERERSLREDRVDGGFLVTQGVYTGTEDFKEKVVRHLMIERRLAPFFKGLSDHECNWTDAQLVAAVQGLPIPPANVPTPAEPRSPSPLKDMASSENLTVPLASRSRAQSYTSDGSNRSNTSTPSLGFSSVRARSKTMMAISGPKNPTLPSTASPPETNNPSTFVDGRPVEAVLYKNAIECPICFLYYPPHLNKTRCCDQEICSECFVQIKRADPHLPEHHDGPPTEDQATSIADQLMSEPATCPFCKQADFGVVYTPPPFRRGLVYISQASAVAQGTSANLSNSSSTTSLSGGLSSSPPASPGGRRRMTFGKDAPEVVTTDRIRPDWAQKLANARSHAARRAAAATALHTAAFLMQPPSGSSSFPGRRLMRRAVRDGGESPSPGASGSATPPREENARSSSLLNLGSQTTRDRHRTAAEAEERLSSLGFLTESRNRHSRTNLLEIGGSRENNRRSRLVDLEEMMLMEAIRLSLAEEEERKRRHDTDTEEKKDTERETRQEKERERESLDAPAAMNDDSSLSGYTPVEGKGKSVDRSGSPAAGPSASLNVPASSSSDASSFTSAPEGGIPTPDYFHTGQQTPENAGSGEESMFNFRSLAEMIEEEEVKQAKDEECAEAGHVEHVEHTSCEHLNRDGVPVVGDKAEGHNNGHVGKCAEVTMERINDEQSA